VQQKKQKTEKEELAWKGWTKLDTSHKIKEQKFRCEDGTIMFAG
jgi:hypothetical protein